MEIRDLVPARLRPLAKALVDGADRRIHPVTMTARLDPITFTGTIEARRRSVTVEEGSRFTVPVAIHNGSASPWSSNGPYPVVIRAAWVGRDGAALDEPPVTIELKAPIVASATKVIDVTLPAVDSLGEFGVRLDLCQQGPDATAAIVAATTRLACSITARPEQDMDYVDLYRSADLGQDHWAIVGPQAESEFDRLGTVKLQQLVDLGFTDRSRLLDVGCGTGLLTVAVERFLSDDGAYVGTDIGQEAIDYCRLTYTRPNFRFEVSAMTSLPLDGPWFDAVCFYSVFTHTYPDETTLLLAEAKRLLAPGGFVLADVFVSPMVERFAGNRGALENEPDHLLRLVDLVGLRPELVSTTPWKRFGERRFYRFTHR